MPISRRKARRLAREERKKNNVEGGGEDGESQMSEFIYHGAVRNSMLAQQFMNMVPFLCAAVMFYGLYHTFEQGSTSGVENERGLVVRIFSFFSACEAVLVWWCMRMPQERGGAFRFAGIIAVVEIVCGVVLGFGYGVPFDHSFPLGSILYSVVYIFWKMSSFNSLKMEHAQMKFKLMQEENMAKGNR